MAGARTIEPRTVLETLLRQRDRTYEETARDFDFVARSIGERGATISPRHLRRLASGERTGATPTTRRVLQAMFGRSADELLLPAAGAAATTDSSLSCRPLSSDSAQKEALRLAAQRARSFALAVRASMSSEAIEQIHADVRQLATAYPLWPLSETLGHLIEVQNVAFSLIEARLRPGQLRQLYFLAGVVGGLLANASHDLGNPSTAFTQARAAFICADHAEHDGLRAWIRGMQSIEVALMGGKVEGVVGLPDEGIRRVIAQGFPASVARCHISSRPF